MNVKASFLLVSALLATALTLGNPFLARRGASLAAKPVPAVEPAAVSAPSTPTMPAGDRRSTVKADIVPAVAPADGRGFATAGFPAMDVCPDPVLRSRAKAERRGGLQVWVDRDGSVWCRNQKVGPAEPVLIRYADAAH